MATDTARIGDIRRFRKDLQYYAEDALRIRTKQATLAPLSFNFAQRTVHANIARQMEETGRVRAIVLKARQEGVSTYTAARFFRRIHLYAQQSGLVIADQKKRSQTLFGIYDLFHRSLSSDLRPRKRYSAKHELWFDTRDGAGGLNSRIQIETAKDVEAGRASTLQLLHASEFAFWDHPEDVWTGLMQAVPDQGSEVIIESTANGVGNLFHEMWNAAVEGSGFIPIFLPWWIHEDYSNLLSAEGVSEILETASDYEREAMEEGFEWEGDRVRLTPQQLAWRRATIRDKMNGNERAFRQEYPATPREAFLVSGNCFFDEDVLLQYERSTRLPLQRANIINVGGAVTVVPAERGYLRIWEKPRRRSEYVIFADTATGKQASKVERTLSDAESEHGGRDFSCADVVEVRSRRLVAQLHGRIPPEVFAQAISDLSYHYSSFAAGTGVRVPGFVGVERNHASGETVLRWLKDQGHPNLYYMRKFNQRYQRTTQRLGWMTTVDTRMPMLDELAQAFREGTIGVPDADTLRECFTFIRGEDGKPQAQEGCHDDRVIALAGTLQLLRYFARPTMFRGDEFERTDSPTGMMVY